MNTITMRSRRLLPLAIALALGVPAAQAATITVTNGGDAGTAGSCTLRQALDSANNDDAGTSTCVAGSGADTVQFAANLKNSTITLAGQPLSISSPVTLNGSGQTINANNTSPVLSVDPTVTSYVSNLTLTGGNSGPVPLAGGVNIMGQIPPPGNRFAPQAARRSTPITHAPQPGQGVTFSRVTITGNTSKYAGGMLVAGGYASLYQCTVSNNTATSNIQYIAGGIVTYDSAVILEFSTISGNTAPSGGVNASGAVTAVNAILVLADSTVSGNSASGTDYVTGGVSQSATAGKYGVLGINATIAGNTATSAGTHVAGGLMFGTGGATELENSIVDANTASSGTTPNLATFGTGTAEIASTLLGPELQASYAGNGNIFAANPQLGPLANNGGPTLTRALLAGSPAINAGNNDDTSGIPTDQRGTGFARIVGPAVDMGAFEVQGAAAASTLPVPVLSTWGAALLAGVLALFGFVSRRRRN